MLLTLVSCNQEDDSQLKRIALFDDDQGHTAFSASTSWYYFDISASFLYDTGQVDTVIIESISGTHPNGNPYSGNLKIEISDGGVVSVAGDATLDQAVRDLGINAPGGIPDLPAVPNEDLTCHQRIAMKTGCCMRDYPQEYHWLCLVEAAANTIEQLFQDDCILPPVMPGCYGEEDK